MIGDDSNLYTDIDNESSSSSPFYHYLFESKARPFDSTAAFTLSSAWILAPFKSYFNHHQYHHQYHHQCSHSHQYHHHFLGLTQTHHFRRCTQHFQNNGLCQERTCILIFCLMNQVHKISPMLCFSTGPWLSLSNKRQKKYSLAIVASELVSLASGLTMISFLITSIRTVTVTITKPCLVATIQIVIMKLISRMVNSVMTV